jgi:glutaredoxin-related protein
MMGVEGTLSRNPEIVVMKPGEDGCRDDPSCGFRRVAAGSALADALVRTEGVVVVDVLNQNIVKL